MTRLFFKTIRWLLGGLIIAADRVFPPRSIKRSPEQQARVNQSAAALVLYEFQSCPFCIKVRRMGRRLNVPLVTRNVLSNDSWHQELVELGGKRKVPCLRIEDKTGESSWLYDSKAINHYLEQRFSV